MIRHRTAGILLILASCLLPISSGFSQTVVHWPLDRSDSPLVENRAVGAARCTGGSPAGYSDDLPGAVIYDPLTQKSRSNLASALFAGNEALAVDVDFVKAGLAGQSMTIECFAKPAPGARGDAWLAGKSRTGNAGAELSVEWHELRQHGQTFHGGAYAAPGKRPSRWVVGHYLSSSRLTRDSDTWRHVAVVYDADAGTVTGWVDYHLVQSIKAAGPPAWDEGPFRIGGSGDRWGMSGKLDEVRVVRGALGPAQFLRARADVLSGVSLASNQQIVPRDAGCLDVKEHFGAVGDGRTDDMAAFNAALAHLADKVPLAYNTLVIPPGTYLVSGTVRGSRFIDVKGAGPEQTVIRLKDETFTDPARPRPVLRMSSTDGDPGSHRATNGSSISIYLDGLTIDTGRGNPGAKALEYHSNNVGRLENVVLRSGDGAGAIGLDLTHHDVGPALVKRVRIEGFDYGAAIRYQEYSMTLEHVTLIGQRIAGIRNQGNILAIRGLRSTNRVPALVAEGANSMVTLLDSTLHGGGSSQPAIRAEGGLYCLRVRTEGYAGAIAKRTLVQPTPPEWKETIVAGPNLDEYVGDQPVVGHGSPAGALRLSIEETPEPPLPPVSQWVNVAKFAEKRAGDDWSPAVQAAIESGARVLYFPKTEPFEFHTPIRLHGKVERLVGFGRELNWPAQVWKEQTPREQTDTAGAPPALLIFDEPEAGRVVMLDRLGCVHIHHASPATLVLRSSTPDRYTTGAAGGKLFAEDIGGADWHFDHPQRVWIRQWNPESHAAGPCIHSRGATIWALGFKTEYESQKLLAEAGAQTEILGSFIYPLGKIPPDRPIFENRDSRIALVYGTSVYHANHQLHVRDVQGADVKQIGSDRLKWAGSRARMDLYSSDAR